MAQAGQAAAQAQKDQAARDLVSLQAPGLQKAQGELSATQQQLAAAGEKLQTTGAALAEEKKARADAEKRARDAMDKLAVAAALAIKEEPRGTVITLPGSVLFQVGQVGPLAAARRRSSTQVADALKNQADHKMIVEGHTDSQGTES